MSKFNKTSPERSIKTTNLAGGEAYKLNKKIELFSAVITTFLQDKLYENAYQRMNRISALASDCDPEFVAKVAVWARKDGYLRSAPIYLTALLTKFHNGDDLVRRTVRNVVNRADEITELLGAYRTLFGDDAPFSKQMMKGIADCFNKFDEYQLSKYNREGQFSLKDALFLTYPKGKDKKQSKIFDKLANDELKTAETWETSLSANDGIDKGEKWELLINEERLGHMALLRNLRNILDNVKDKKVIEKAAKQLCNEDSVLRGKQFPFRYLAAHNEIEDHANAHTTLFLDAIEDAISIAAANIPGFSKNDSVAIFNDVSGSMQHPISERSSVMADQVGMILGAILRSNCKSVITGVFGDRAKIINTPSRGSIIQNCKAVSEYRNDVGHGTNGDAAIDILLKNQCDSNKVVVITDMQMRYGSFKDSWNSYKKKNPEAKLYIVDVAGYGATPINTLAPDVVYISGWNDKVFAILDALDNGEKLVKMIGQIEL